MTPTPLADRRRDLLAALSATYHDRELEEIEALARELLQAPEERLPRILRQLSTEMHPSPEKVRRLACDVCEGSGRVSRPACRRLRNGQVWHGEVAEDCPACGNGRRMPAPANSDNPAGNYTGGDAA